mgnify:CR=1 FL=1
MINFIHGDVFMVGAFFCFVAVVYLGLPFLPTLLLTMVGAALLGVLIERLSYKPLHNVSRASAMITALGARPFSGKFHSGAGALPQVHPGVAGKYVLGLMRSFHVVPLQIVIIRLLPWTGADVLLYCAVHRTPVRMAMWACFLG